MSWAASSPKDEQIEAPSKVDQEITLHLDADLYEAIAELAQRDDRSEDRTILRLLHYALTHITWPEPMDQKAATAKSVKDYVNTLRQIEGRADSADAHVLGQLAYLEAVYGGSAMIMGTAAPHEHPAWRDR